MLSLLRLSKKDGQLLSEPDTISRGFVYRRDSEELIDEVNQLVTKTISELQRVNGNRRNIVRQNVKKATETFLYSKIKRRPMILPIIIET